MDAPADLVAEEQPTRRLRLTRLQVDDAAETTAVPADAELYPGTGGAAPSLAQLQERYRRQRHGPSAPGPGPG